MVQSSYCYLINNYTEIWCKVFQSQFVRFVNIVPEQHSPHVCLSKYIYIRNKYLVKLYCNFHLISHNLVMLNGRLGFPFGVYKYSYFKLLTIFLTQTGLFNKRGSQVCVRLEQTIDQGKNYHLRANKWKILLAFMTIGCLSWHLQ